MDRELFKVFRKKYYNAKDRCINKNNNRRESYGGRGIKCMWESSEEFKIDMRESFLDHVNKHGVCDTTLDRIDVDGDYCKENCRWATWEDQNKNKRECREFDYNGKHFQTLRDLAEYVGINEATISFRLKSGWSLEKAATTEVLKHEHREKKEPTRKRRKEIEYNGTIFKSIKDLSKYLGISYNTVKGRIRRGYVGEEILRGKYFNS